MRTKEEKQYLDRQAVCARDRAREVQRWLDDTTDLRLVDRILNGDQEASNLLYERHGKPIKGFIAMRVKNNDPIYNLCQETCLEIRTGLVRFDPARGSFHGFSMGCARNVLRRFWSDRPSQFEIPPDGEDEQGDFPDGNQVSPADTALFDRLMDKTFGGGSPPHQLIAFGYVQLLKWKPSEVVEELSGFRLDVLTERLESELCVLFSPQESIVRQSFRNLNRMMRDRKKLSEVVADPKTRKTYPRLLACIVAETYLRDYYTSKQPWNSRTYSAECAQNVTNWWVSVKKRVIRCCINIETY